MLPFFPRPYPDELLYSVCARYHARSNNACIKDSVQELFGSRTATAVVDLPSRLGYLSSQFSPNTLNTYEKLLNEHTLLPLYRPFLPPDRLNRVVKAMKSSHRGSSIHTMIGVMASAIPTVRFLRWCPDCVAADREDMGEPYWHRSHQVAGVSVCHRHGAILREHDSLLVSDRNKHLFQPFPEVMLEGQAPFRAVRDHEHRLAIAKGVSWLLENHDTPVLGLAALHDRYLHFLKGRSFASFSGRVSQHELLDAFVAFYGKSYLDEMHSPVDRDSESNWLSILTRKPRSEKTSHPIRHLLLMRFLCLDVENFFSELPAEKELFGSGPWPCLNPVASHYRQPMITHCTITRNCESGKPVGNFHCSCGFSYARTGPDTSDGDRFRRGRMLGFGSVWEAELLRLMREEKLGLRPTARILGVDTNTVKKHLSRLEAEVRGEIKKTKKDGLLKGYRARWLRLCKDNEGKGRTALRGMDPATYAWLYRNDREWLFLYPAGGGVSKVPAPRVNWAERDVKLALDVVEASKAILHQPGRPVRITISAIGKKLGFLGLIQKQLGKLPKTTAVLKQILEDHDTYSIRRVRYAVVCIATREEPLEEWRIVREAGLRPGYATAVHREIQRAIAAGGAGIP